MTLGPRPDLIDRCIEIWLSWAVGIAAVASAPFDAIRAPWPGTDEQESP